MCTELDTNKNLTSGGKCIGNDNNMDQEVNSCDDYDTAVYISVDGNSYLTALVS